MLFNLFSGSSGGLFPGAISGEEAGRKLQPELFYRFDGMRSVFGSVQHIEYFI